MDNAQNLLAMRIILLLLFMTPGLFLTGQHDDFQTHIEAHRDEYKAEFLKDPRSPIQSKKLLRKLRFFKPDGAYRVQALFSLKPDAQPFEIATYSGITKPYIQFGWLDFEIENVTLRLAVYKSIRLGSMPGFEDYLFLPFKDLTNGEQTYGGGRYIDLKASEIDQSGLITLDFNKAYNPWCAYSEGYNCPVPPAVNHLEVAITAGERSPGFEVLKD